MGNRFVPLALHETQPEEAGCLPGTRVHVLSMFMEWARNDPIRIFWLAGLAGTGKTSIAITLCRMLQDEPDIVLGGTFFCSRTANVTELTDARCILPTLAASLAGVSHVFAVTLAAALNKDSLAASKPISAQMNTLLQQPLSALSQSSPSIVFVVDAIDECSDENEVKKLLVAISTLACDANVKFIITSRPETHINASPISRIDRSSILRLHTIDIDEVTEDIRLYIHDAFSKQPLEKAWYTDSEVDLLTDLADGLFIFASTVIAYVLDSESVDDRAARLRTALFAMKASMVATGPLDAIYEFVLTRASSTAKVEPAELETTQKVLACILTAEAPLSITALANIIAENPDVLRASLRRLRAVVHVPDEAEELSLHAVHASFGDYLFERAADNLLIPSLLGDELLARGCLRIMREHLHFNVSQCYSSHELNPPAHSSTVPLSLEYACLEWAYHLVALEQPNDIEEELNDMFRSHFLFWLEVICILNEVQRAEAMLNLAASTVS